MTNGQTLKVSYVIEKATPGTIRYMEVDERNKKRRVEDGAIAPTLYLRKTALGSTPPQRLEVTITAR